MRAWGRFRSRIKPQAVFPVQRPASCLLSTGQAGVFRGKATRYGWLPRGWGSYGDLPRISSSTVKCSSYALPSAAEPPFSATCGTRRDEDASAAARKKKKLKALGGCRWKFSRWTRTEDEQIALCSCWSNTRQPAREACFVCPRGVTRIWAFFCLLRHFALGGWGALLLCFLILCTLYTEKNDFPKS